MCPLPFLHFKKYLANQKVPGWPRDFRPEITGLVVGFRFCSCFSKFELPGFVLVPDLELFRTSWFRSSSWTWKPTFI